jgi:type II secretory pathway predicted ATPase ExeA
MYLNHYGLKEPPFGLTPDPKFIFKTESYLEALSTIKYGVEESKGIIILVGEVGTGKTTTLRSAIQHFGRHVQSAYIFNPSLTVAEFFEQICSGFGLGLSRTASKPERLDALGRLLTQRHAQGLRTALIIDEAHGLPEEVLEEVRLLVNFETSSEKLLQVILCGQPELSAQLNRPDLRQLKQRVSLRCSLKPLTPFEVNEYIRFRLKVAGAPRVNLFEPEAVALISRISQGVPRVINNICDNALLYGFSSDCPLVGTDLVQEVIQTLDLGPTEPVMAREGFGSAIRSVV